MKIWENTSSKMFICNLSIMTSFFISRKEGNWFLTKHINHITMWPGETHSYIPCQRAKVWKGYRIHKNWEVTIYQGVIGPQPEQEHGLRWPWSTPAVQAGSVFSINQFTAAQRWHLCDTCTAYKLQIFPRTEMTLPIPFLTYTKDLEWVTSS